MEQWNNGNKLVPLQKATGILHRILPHLINFPDVRKVTLGILFLYDDLLG